MRMSAIADMRWGPIVPRVPASGILGSRLRGNDSSRIAPLTYCIPSALVADEKGPAGGSQRGQVEGGNAQEGGGRTCHHHRSLGDVQTIDGIQGVVCEPAHIHARLSRADKPAI